MYREHNRAFKEWAVACNALGAGQQTFLIRKGGIREEGGVFTINDTEFFLMPTYEHQDERLVQPASVDRLRAIQQQPRNPHEVLIEYYAVVDTIVAADTDEQVFALARNTIWNDEYVKLRLEYNPYDPLYLVLLRVFRLPEPATLPMIPDYSGCRSWVTLDRKISTAGLAPAISDSEFADAREKLLEQINNMC